MANIEITCPHCGQALKFPPHLAGASVACPACKGNVSVSAGSNTQPPPPEMLRTKPTLRRKAETVTDTAETVTCPRCHAQHPAGTVICVDCGCNIQTGQVLASFVPLREGVLAWMNRKNITTASVVAVLLLLGVAGVCIYNKKAPEMNFKAGQEALATGSAEKAFAKFMSAAMAGHISAQHALAECYATGQGVKKDLEAAVEWYQKAAANKNVDAQAKLGLCYLKGTGVTQDPVEAVKWFREAAEKGNAKAQCSLGGCYDKGTGVVKDVTQAVEWFRRAAEQGYAKAQSNLGNCYECGDGVAKNEKIAVDWYRKAAEQGDGDAQCNLGIRYANGSGVAKNEKVAVDWYRRAAEQGDGNAQCNLGVCYSNGFGVAKNDKIAVDWYRQAAEQGYAGAQYNLGVCYANGDGVAKNDKIAVDWYRKAAEQGDAHAQYNLGGRYFTGEGITKDEQQAAKWYRKAAEQGHADAQFNFATCCFNGTGVAEDKRTAAEWFLKAAEQGHASSQLLLGDCYANGQGIVQDFDEAKKWYSKAASSDNAEVVILAKEKLSGSNVSAPLWQKQRDAIVKKTVEQADKEVSLQAAATAMKIAYPLSKTTASMATIESEVGVQLASETKLLTNEALWKTEAEKKYPLWKVGETVTMKCRNGTVIGKIYRIDKDGIRVGDNFINTLDVPSEALIHLDTTERMLLLKKFINDRRMELEGKREQFSEMLWTDAAKKYNLVNFNGKWYTDEDMTQLLVASRKQLIQTQAFKLQAADLATLGFVWYDKSWYPKDIANQMYAQVQAAAKARAEALAKAEQRRTDEANGIHRDKYGFQIVPATPSSWPPPGYDGPHSYGGEKFRKIMR